VSHDNSDVGGRQSAAAIPAPQAGVVEQASAASEQTPALGRSDASPETGLVASGAAHQIADRVAREAGALAAHAAGRSEGPTFSVRHESPVKVLHIQLQPADLGTVTVRMAVKDNALSVDLEVGQGDTAHLLQRDREALIAMLRSAGYLIEGLDVRLADQAAANAQIISGQGNAQAQGGSHSGSSGSEARSSGERPQDERRNPSFGDRNNEDEQAGRADRRGGVYI
jgi:chemotaxis protein MotD